MLLPNRDRATIDQQKLVDYLLNPSHPDNGGKAAFFEGWGFSRVNSNVLERAIRHMIARSNVTRQVKSAWGIKYVVDGPLAAPAGTTPAVRTIWIIDATDPGPRLVTAYPLGKELTHD